MDNKFLLLIILKGFLLTLIQAQGPGFVNLDCGGISQHTDDIGLQWKPDSNYLFGQRANTSFSNDNKAQYNTVRYFPQDDHAKYCYDLQVTAHKRFLVRATFLYGNFDKKNVYPRFQISLGATYWDDIAITNVAIPVMTEMVILAPSPSISVCLFNASSGVPFISTIELRQFNDDMYYSRSEAKYYMFVSRRVNMGARSNASIRYPDDPFDRIWESDASETQSDLALYNGAPGTQKVATNRSIKLDQEAPPLKVMQTAVLGDKGLLSYTVNLPHFPGIAWVAWYLAEIEDLGANETRIFIGRFSSNSINELVVRNTGAMATEGGYWDASLPSIAPMHFIQTNDSSRGPILNALEILKHVFINFGSFDANATDSLVSNYPDATWAQEGGDPCSPVPWTWVQCNSDSQPRITSIKLSRKNLTGDIPLQLTNISEMVELHLDGNSLSGAIPDFSRLTNIEIIHLENNALTSSLPSSLAKLPKLKELYVQNNKLSGAIPEGLLREGIIFNYSGNPGIQQSNEAKKNLVIVLPVIGAVFLLVFIAVYLFCRHKKKKNKRGAFGRSSTGQSNLLSQLNSEQAQRFELSEIEVATENFDKVIGKGGFGSVYYGKLSDDTEIAVKVHNSGSNQGILEFINEVTLLSRVHHRNLVKLLGYSIQPGNNILVYEFMHEGTLSEHIRGRPEKKIVSWLKRMEIAEDAAKGIEYLHTGCMPVIIHRDLKSNNILLDKNMRAKVSDFGLSKLMADNSQISSMVKGTLGYLDPEYYATQKFTEKSDIYSFGVILLELISGYNPISSEHFGEECNYIVSWAMELIATGDIQAIIDKSLEPTYDVQSVWKVTEIALMCVNSSRIERPSISEVLKEIQDAIMIEQKASKGRVESIDILARKPLENHPKFNISCSTSSDNSILLDDTFINPSLR